MFLQFASQTNDSVGLVSGGLDVTTVSIIITILGAIITAAVFITRLELRVRHLEKHPIIEAVSEVNKDDAIKFYRAMRNLSQQGGTNK